MLKSDDDEQLRNYIIILFGVLIIYTAALFVTFNHQYQIVKTQSLLDLYDQKVDIYDALSTDIDQINLCQKEMSDSSDRKNDFALFVECNQYPIDLDLNLKKISEFFNLDDDTLQKISTILNRKNKMHLDQASILSINQLLDILDKQLTEDEKEIRSPKVHNYEKLID